MNQLILNIAPPNFSSYQDKFLYSKKRFTVTEASTKTGKTFSHIFWIYQCAHATSIEEATKINPYLKPAKEGNEYWWCAPIYQQSQIAFNRLKRKVDKTGVYSINKSELTITTPIDTIIRFKTSRDPDNLYGEDVYAAVMDEFTRMKQEAWFALRSTLTATKAPAKFIGNYKGKSNWGHQLTLKANEVNSEYERFRITAWDAVNAGILDKEEVEQAKMDLPDFMFKALYLAEGDVDEARLIDDDSIKDLTTNKHVQRGQKYLTADIAFEGSDKFVICVWDGWRLIALKVYPKTKPNEVETLIKGIAVKYSVPQSHIVFDADGVGGFLKGYLKNAKEFHNNSQPIKQQGEKQDYKNLKSQCYFGLARKINASEMFIECDVSEYWTEIIEDFECVKNRSFGLDGKLEILRKSEVKQIIMRSPDYSDAIMMRYYFDVKPKSQTYKMDDKLNADDLGLF